MCASKCVLACEQQTYFRSSLSVSGTPLSDPLKSCLCHLFVSSQQCFANPPPCSFSYLLLYRPLPCLSPQLFISDSFGPPNPSDLAEALVNKHLQFLLQLITWSISKCLHHTNVGPFGNFSTGFCVSELTQYILIYKLSNMSVGRSKRGCRA